MRWSSGIELKLVRLFPMHMDLQVRYSDQNTTQHQTTTLFYIQTRMFRITSTTTVSHIFRWLTLWQYKCQCIQKDEHSSIYTLITTCNRQNDIPIQCINTPDCRDAVENEQLWSFKLDMNSGFFRNEGTIFWLLVTHKCSLWCEEARTIQISWSTRDQSAFSRLPHHHVPFL